MRKRVAVLASVLIINTLVINASSIRPNVKSRAVNLHKRGNEHTVEEQIRTNDNQPSSQSSLDLRNDSQSGGLRAKLSNKGTLSVLVISVIAFSLVGLYFAALIPATSLIIAGVVLALAVLTKLFWIRQPKLSEEKLNLIESLKTLRDNLEEENLGKSHVDDTETSLEDLLEENRADSVAFDKAEKKWSQELVHERQKDEAASELLPDIEAKNDILNSVEAVYNTLSRQNKDLENMKLKQFTIPSLDKNLPYINTNFEVEEKYCDLLTSRAAVLSKNLEEITKMRHVQEVNSAVDWNNMRRKVDEYRVNNDANEEKFQKSVSQILKEQSREYIREHIGVAQRKLKRVKFMINLSNTPFGRVYTKEYSEVLNQREIAVSKEIENMEKLENDLERDKFTPDVVNKRLEEFLENYVAGSNTFDKVEGEMYQELPKKKPFEMIDEADEKKSSIDAINVTPTSTDDTAAENDENRPKAEGISQISRDSSQERPTGLTGTDGMHGPSVSALPPGGKASTAITRP